MRALKAVLNADKFDASTLARFQNTWKRMNQGKTQCWALFVISKTTFTETAIKKIRR